MVWQSNQPREHSSLFANTLAKFVCSRWKPGQPAHWAVLEAGAVLGSVRVAVRVAVLVSALCAGVDRRPRAEPAVGLACAHSVIQVQLRPAAALHLLLNLAELMLHLADDIFPVLKLLVLKLQSVLRA